MSSATDSASDRDIWRSAAVLIREYGDAAAFHAAQRADELFERGDIDGQRTWMRIMRAIEALQSNEPQGPAI